MYTRPEFRIKSESFQAMLNDFIPTSIHWSGLASNKLDHILAYQMRNRLAFVERYMYSRFDRETEELVFVGPSELDGKQFMKLTGADSVIIKETTREYKKDEVYLLDNPAAETSSEAHVEARTDEQRKTETEESEQSNSQEKDSFYSREGLREQT